MLYPMSNPARKRCRREPATVKTVQNFKAEVADIKRVALHDIAEITYYERRRTDTGQVVLINLINDGAITVTYDAHGTVENVRGNHVQWHMSEEGVVTLASLHAGDR